MSKYLVTGGAGFIPSHLAAKLASKNDSEVVIVDNMLTGSAEKVPKADNITFIKGDVNNYNDISSIFLHTRFDYVFHYAAVVGVFRTLENPTLVLKDIDGIRNILDLAKNTGVKRVFYSSSSEVYGESVEYPQVENTTPLNSRLPYAIVKNIGEAFLRSYQQEYGLDYTIFRFFNTYGPKQSEDFVVSKFINAALEGRDITVYGEGSQSRTFCNIKDNIDATVNTLNDESTINSVINIGNEKETTILELANAVIKATSSRSKIVHLPPLEEGDMKRRQPDNTRMKKILGRKLIPLDQGLAELVRST